MLPGQARKFNIRALRVNPASIDIRRNAGSQRQSWRRSAPPRPNGCPMEILVYDGTRDEAKTGIAG
jgi:hypothetical protein